MSKSRRNGVDPQALVDRYGADTARLFTMSNVPPEHTFEWSDEGVEGAFRFMKRLWKLVHAHVEGGPAARPDAAALDAPQRDAAPPGAPDARQGRRRHRPPPHVQHGDRRGHGTLQRARRVPGPLAAGPRRDAGGARPRRADALADRPARGAGDVARARACDAASSTSAGRRPTPPRSCRTRSRSSCRSTASCAGGLRLPPAPTRRVVREAALADPGVAKFVAGQPVRKLIYVPGKLVNVVV